MQQVVQRHFGVHARTLLAVEYIRCAGHEQGAGVAHAGAHRRHWPDMIQYVRARIHREAVHTPLRIMRKSVMNLA